MKAAHLTPASFAALLPDVCIRETSADPDGWTAENPLWGHCAVVSAAAQKLFGGKLLRASLEALPAFAHMRSHYINELDDGTRHDFTRAQLGDADTSGLVFEERTREYVLSHQPTRERYLVLAGRLAAAVPVDDVDAEDLYEFLID
ncbi:MAG: hypothetical protein QY323_03800 [Patescibacteria group bacterium]|nr:MAG: hypothetical protein QY323_03800 [Patescibacteria group bacterium]